MSAPLGPIQVTLGGFTVGETRDNGARVHLAQLTGWWDPAASTGAATQRANDHGAWIGPAYYGPRILGVLARIDGTSPADSMTIAGLLLRAVPLDQLAEVSVKDEAETLTARVRQEGDPLLDRKGNRVTVSLSLLAPDPRRYGPPATADTGLAATTGGLSLPIVLPVSLGATASAGTLTVTNAGDMDSYPVFTVTGPCAPFTVSDAAGRQLAYADTVPAGRTLVIDTALRSALLDGIANRVVTGTWLRLTPGINQFSFKASSYDAASRLAIAYRSARR